MLQCCNIPPPPCRNILRKKVYSTILGVQKRTFLDLIRMFAKFSHEELQIPPSTISRTALGLVPDLPMNSLRRQFSSKAIAPHHHHQNGALLQMKDVTCLFDLVGGMEKQTKPNSTSFSCNWQRKRGMTGRNFRPPIFLVTKQTGVSNVTFEKLPPSI